MPATALRHARTACSVVLAVVGAACLLATLAALAFGARPLVIKTGSMDPQLPVGTVVIARPVPATTASVGEVVAVVRRDGKRILHRVKHVTPTGADAATIVLHGDRNKRPDPPVTVTRVERPVLTVPLIGRMLGWIQGPWTQYWLGVLTGLLFTLVGVRTVRRRNAQPIAHGS